MKDHERPDRDEESGIGIDRPVAETDRAGVDQQLLPDSSAQGVSPIADADALEEPAFLDDEGPSADIPPFITTTNARELYDLRPGETVSEAIARRAAKLAR